MKRNRAYYNESRDQSVPFALPALKSYKQNLLFPEGSGKKPAISAIPASENKKPPSKSPAKPRLSSKSPKRGTSANLPIYKPLRSRPPPKPNSTLTAFPSQKPLIKPNLSRSSDKRPVRSPLTTKKQGSPPRAKHSSTQKPNTARLPLRNTASAPRGASPTNLKAQDNRSNSISSSKSMGHAFIAKTPRVTTVSSRNEPRGGTLKPDMIPEFSQKHPRMCATRSVSRKRPHKKGGHSFFDFELGPYKMSDLSIMPLL